MEAVPVEMVEQRIQEAVTYHDVLSIFYGDRLTNDIIDNVLATEWRGRMSSKVRPRPRIGGLSDTLSFSPQETTFQGRRPSLNSSHVCLGHRPTPRCVSHLIVGRTRVKNTIHSKSRIRRHKKKRGKRKGRRGRKRKRKGKKRKRKRGRNKKRKGSKRKGKGRRRKKGKINVPENDHNLKTKCSYKLLHLSIETKNNI